MLITIKKSVAVAKVWLSILNNNIYVAVSDIALFLNVLFGTYTVTGQKVNEMLENTGYQITKTLYNGVYEYNLINTQKDEIDYDILQDKIFADIREMYYEMIKGD